MWDQARDSLEPPKLKEKVFMAKCKIPVLESYGGEKYPEEYWECWPSQRLEDAKVKTWVNHEELEELCKEVGIAVEFGQAWVVLRDLRFGADLGAVGRSRLGSQGPNGKLALEHGAKVQDTIGAFIQKEFYVGPLTLEETEVLGPLKVHPISVRLKPDGSARVITDASYPYDASKEEDSEEPASLNQFIDITRFPVKMDGMLEFLGQLEDEGKGALLAKEDLTDAYKHIPVRREDWRLQALAWGDRFFLDTRLMFGTSSSAGIFDRFDGLLLRIAVKLSRMEGRKAKRFLDDVFAVESRLGGGIHDFLEKYREVCNRVGARLDPKKRVLPGTKTTILGVEFDTIKWVWWVSEEKARKVWDKLLNAETRWGSLKDRQSLQGSLLSVSDLMPEARLMHAELFRYVEEGGLLREDCARFWRTVIKRAMMGCSIPVPRRWLPGDYLEVHPDAAGPQPDYVGRGVGLVLGDGRWGFLPYPSWMGMPPKWCSPVFWKGEPVDFRHKLSFLEALGPLWAIVELGNEASGKTILARVDNLGVVYTSAGGYSASCPFLNAVIQATTVVSKGLGTRLVIRHVPR